MDIGLGFTFALTLLAPRFTDAATQAASAPYRAPATGAGNSHSPVFSADGRHVAFVSHANNLVTNDDLGPHLDLFVRDLVASNTVLVSMSTNGFGGANDNVGLYTLSSNALVVAFDTAASNLVPWDNNRVSDVYVRDLVFGATTRVSLGLDEDANGPSFNPLVSEDGRYIIFESLASNLVTNDFNGTNDIFIHDLMTGTTELVSVNTEGTASPNGPSHSPSISADGLTVAFVSHATNLVAGVTNRLGEVYARNVAGRTTRWAVASHLPEAHAGFTDTGFYQAFEPALSADGRFVAFKTPGQAVRFDLARPTNSAFIFITNSPRPDLQISRVNFHDNPRPAVSTDSTPLAFSGDGRFLAINTTSNFSPYPGIAMLDFELLTTNVQSSDPRFYTTNIFPTLNLVLTNQGSIFARTWLRMPWLSMNQSATRLSFLCDATNLFAGTADRSMRLYDLSIATGFVDLLITNGGRVDSDLSAIVPSLSSDGSLIAWDTPDDNIVPDDLNRAWDVFVRNVDTDETQLISARHPDLPAASGTALSRLDLNPGAISANGQRVAILSLDNTLAPDDTNNWRDLFVRDFVTGTNFDVSRSIGRVLFSSQTNFPGTNTAIAPFLSADGRQVVFAGETSFSLQSTNRTIYWRNLQSSSNHVVVTGDSLSRPVLSPNARFVAFHSAATHDPYYPDGNNQFDVYLFGSRTVSASDAMLIDCNLDQSIFPPRFVSTAWQTTTPANGPSINPAFSSDSRWILFESLAVNLLQNPIASQSSYQLYARSFVVTNRPAFGCGGRIDVLDYTPTKLVSYTTSASPDLNGTSTDLPLPGGGANPRFSADSRYVAFESYPYLIYRHDLLHDFVITVTEQAGVRYTNVARMTNDLVCSDCRHPTLSADGRFVAYQSPLFSGPVGNVSVRDLQTGQEELVSVNLTDNGGGNGSSSSPLISYDARFVVFASNASDLVPGDNNRAMDIFVRDRLNHVTHCLSRNFVGTGTGNRVSSNPILSADGRTVAFQSFASDLVPGDYNDTRDVFVVTFSGPDTDSDGMDDDWEMAYFSTLARDGSGDFDNDGASDLAEFRAGTNPVNDASILRVLQLTTAFVPASSQSVRSRKTVVLWNAVPGRTYRLQYKLSLNGSWQAVGADVVASSVSASATHTIDLTYASDRPYGFYRVLLVQ